MRWLACFFACLAACGCAGSTPGPEPAAPAASSRPTSEAGATGAPTHGATTPADPNQMAERLVAMLGAERFRDRDAATEELLQMGKEILPVLRRHEDHADIEVRQRVLFLLMKLDPPPLSTLQFESGELKLEETDSAKLEAMLTDLHRRKVYSLSRSGGQPDKDSVYLSGWIERVTAELHRRGQGK